MRTGSYNHNEIVVESGLRPSEPAPKDIEANVTLRAGALGHNHNEIVVESSVRPSEPAQKVTLRAGAIGGNHNQIVVSAPRLARADA